MTIDLSKTDPRQWQQEIERALTRANYVAVAEALHSARPRDLAEVLVMLPADVTIDLWGDTPNDTVQARVSRDQ